MKAKATQFCDGKLVVEHEFEVIKPGDLDAGLKEFHQILKRTQLPSCRQSVVSVVKA